MKMKRLLLLVLMLCLCIGLMSVTASATELKYENTYAYDSNDAIIPRSGQSYLTSIEEVGAAVRKAMVNREESVVIYFRSPLSQYSSVNDVLNDALDVAFAHTGKPTEGDYLRWVRGKVSVKRSSTTDSNYRYMTLTFPLSYYTTAAQEAELTTSVNKLLAEKITSGMSDYDKLTAVYDWMTENIYYDYDNLTNDNYDLKYTAYAAMIHKTSVCQGYASLLYRFALEMGIDCRIISGFGNTGAHGWNIIKLGGKYYNLDATWDASYRQAGYDYIYYLRCANNFGSHTRDAEYDTTEFHSLYPMSSSDYSSTTDPCAKGHSLQVIVTDPTCTSQGTRHTYCQNCSYSELVYLDKTPHNYKSSVVAPTCASGGYTNYFCVVCGTSYTADNTPAKGHSYGNWVITQAPTCTADGLQQRTCSDCSSGEIVAVPAKGHSYTNKVTAPTCTAQGYTTCTCSTCGDSYKTNYTSAKGHSYTSKVTSATCTSQGYTTYTCSCGASYKDNYTAVKGHSWDSGVVTKQPTEQASGVKTYTCSSCKTTKTESIPALTHSHSYTSKVTAATCTAQGYTTYTCSCGASYKDNYTAVKSHSYGSWTTTKAATCTTDGTQKRTCTNCSAYETKAIAAKGHSYTSKVTAAACTAQGYTTYTCSCGSSYTDNYTAVKGHSWNSGVVTKQPTEKATGIKTYTCSTCKTTREEAIPALTHSHSYTSKVTAATCTAQGYTTYTCSCGASYKDDYTAVKSHSYGSWIVTNPATCTADGTQKRTCVNCTASETKTIPATGHNYQNGTCTGCGDKNNTIAAPTLKSANDPATGKIKLTWNKVDGAVKYKVYRATSKNGTYSRRTTTSKVSFTNSNAVAGKYYYYYVVAVAADGTESAKSNIVGRTCDLAQTKVTLSNKTSNGKIVVSWEAVEGATKYQVYRATSKNGTYTRITTTSSTSITNTSTVAGKTYYYKVRAICDKDAAAAAYSDVKSCTCDLAQPSVSIAKSSGKPKVSWKKVDGAVKYKVYRATSKNGNYSLMKTLTGTSWKDTTAKKNKTYYYKVIAVCSNTAGNSAYSKIVSMKATK